MSDFSEAPPIPRRGSFAVTPDTSRQNSSVRGDNGKTRIKDHSEYHCMDGVCIRVRVPNAPMYAAGTNTSTIAPSKKKISDHNFEVYPKEAAERETAQKEQGKSYSPGAFETIIEVSDESIEPNESDDQSDLSSADNQQRRSIDSDLGDAPIYENCFEYLDPVTFAKDFVQQVITESEANVEEKQSSDSAGSKLEDDIGFGYTGFHYVEAKRSFTSWPTINDFTIEQGAYKIDEYVASFDTQEDWMYVIYYQGTQDTTCSTLYEYQAIFSLPTWRYPIAQATASIYFTIEVCKVKPRHCEVDVTYKFETFGHSRKPGGLDFQEQWLHYILDSKIRFFKTVTY